MIHRFFRITAQRAIAQLTTQHAIAQPLDPRRNVASNLIPCLALTILACGLRLYHLGGDNLWRDESVVYWLGNESLPHLWSTRLALTGIHPPLFYSLHHLWNAFLAFVGQPPTAVTVRLPSVVLGTLSIPLWYLLIGRCFSERAAIVGAAFLTVSPAHIAVSRDAKAEVLVIFLLIALIGFTIRLLRVLETWSAGTAEWRNRRMQSCAAGFVATGILLLYAHSVAFVGLFIPSIMFLTMLCSGRLRLMSVVPWALLNLLTILPFLPWLALLHRIAAQQVGYYWLPTINFPQALVETWQVAFDQYNLPDMLGRRPVPDLATLLPGIVVALVLLTGCAAGLRRGPPRRGLVVALLLTPPIIFVLSRMVPIFLEYIVMMFALPLLAAVYGFAAECVVLPAAIGRSLPRPRFPVAPAGMAIAVLLFFSPADGRAYHQHQPQWAKVAALLASHVQAHDVVLFWPAYAEWSTRFYWRPDTSDWRAIDLGRFREFRPLTTVAVIPAAGIPKLAATAPHVWLVVDRLEVGSGDLQPVWQALAKALPGTAVTNYPDGLQVTSFQRP